MPTSVDSLAGAAVQAFNRNNIRKGKKVGVLVAPMSIALPAAFTTGGVTTGQTTTPITLAELTGFKPVGLLRKDDGVAMGRDRDKSEVMAVGFNDPVRTDFTSDVFNAQIVALETNKTTIEKYLNVDLSAVTPDPNTGEIVFPQPADLGVTQNRWAFIGQDGIGASRYWWGRIFTAGVVDETDDQNLASTDDPWTWPMTITSQTDTALGYGVVHFFGGPGWKAGLAAAGFSV